MTYIALNQVLPEIEDPILSFRKHMNFLLALQSRRAGEIVLSSMPIEMTIDATTVCQLSCPFCSTGLKANPRSGKVLQPDVHESFLSSVGDNLFSINYFSTGEPLLNKNLPQLLRHAAAHGIFYIISTNLSLNLSDEQIDDLLTAGPGIISISLDGATRASYSKYRLGGDFGLVVNNMKKLIQRKKALGLTYPILQWRFLVFEHNRAELEDAMRLAGELDVDYFEHYPGSAPEEPNATGVQRYLGNDLPPNDYESSLGRQMKTRNNTLMRQFLNERPRYWEMPTVSFSRPSKCDWLYFGPMIYPDGGVAPCCMSEKLVDDFSRYEIPGQERSKQGLPIEKAWNSYDYLMSRRMFSEGQAHTSICSRCPIPRSQHQQFVFLMQSVLRNAPDWVLGVLAADPDRFFFRLDQALSPKEVGALFSEDFRNVVPAPAPEQLDALLTEGARYLVEKQYEAGAGWAQSLKFSPIDANSKPIPR